VELEDLKKARREFEFRVEPSCELRVASASFELVAAGHCRCELRIPNSEGEGEGEGKGGRSAAAAALRPPPGPSQVPSGGLSRPQTASAGLKRPQPASNGLSRSQVSNNWLHKLQQQAGLVVLSLARVKRRARHRLVRCSPHETQRRAIRRRRSARATVVVCPLLHYCLG
jgi:hypothetical protein